MKKNLGEDLEPTHPLVLELKEKMSRSNMTKEEEERFYQMARDAEEAYVNDPKHGEENRKRVNKIKHDVELMNLRTQEMMFKVKPSN
jgi:hypothetical protein